MLRIEWIDVDGVQRSAIGRGVLRAADPFAPVGIRVEALDTLPVATTVIGGEQRLGRGAGVPASLFLGVSRSEPEDVAHRFAALAALAAGSLGKRGRRCG